jgi:hypothetical protein
LGFQNGGGPDPRGADLGKLYIKISTLN